MNRLAKPLVGLPARGGLGNSDPMQTGQTVTPGSGNAARLNYGRLATSTLRGIALCRSRHLAEPLREAREIEHSTL